MLLLLCYTLLFSQLYSTLLLHLPLLYLYSSLVYTALLYSTSTLLYKALLYSTPTSASTLCSASPLLISPLLYATLLHSTLLTAV